MINKQKKGISLIVLVITIIVMIILAASVIVSLNNTGVIDKAGQAVDETNESELEHMDALDYLDKFTASVENPWDGSTKESFADGNGTENQPYLISNAAELVYFAKLVNEGNTFEGKYVELTANINLNNIEFTPIGMGNSTTTDESQWTSSTVYFNGIFDGKGHIISNLNINKPEVRGVGLFGVTYDKAVIKNVEIFSGNIYGRAAVAGIVGYNKAEISNCINRANVTAVDSETVGNSGQLAGGIVGLSCAGNITNCKNYGNILGEDDVAMRSRGKNVGGIAGEIAGYTDVIISKCYNYGNITTNYQQVGGIAGSAATDEGKTIKIIDCINNGKVHAKKPTKEFVDNVSIGFVGGILGWAGTANVTLENCKNTGAVISDDSTAGGVVGEVSGGSKLIKCTNSGSVEGVLCIGGIVGTLEEGTIENSNNAGAVLAERGSGGITGAIASFESRVYGSSNTGTITANEQQAGGIAGQGCGTIEKCVNSGEIHTANGGGGIVGLSSNKGSTIKDCENRGKVESNNIAGGIVSLVQLATSPIINCRNYGEVISNTQQAGGIAGTTPGNVTDCYNEGKIISNSTGGRGITGGIVGFLTGTVTNSYNKGLVVVGEFDGRPDLVGGIVGLLKGGKISNSYDIGSYSGEKMGAIVGENSEDTPGTITNTYYYTTESIKGVGGTDDVAGQFEKTDLKLDTFEAFKNSSFYAK